MTWVVSPYAVAFRTQQNQYAYSEMNVQEALDESFYWLTTNPQSRFSNFGDKYLSIIGRVSDQIFRKTKGLYYLTNEPIFKLNWGGDLVSSPGYVIKDSLTDKHSDGSWENLYYKVYICKNTFAECFYIKKDIDSYYLKEFCVDRTYFYYIFYTVALLLILGILLFLIILVKRKLPKPLYVRLLKSCNPINFMKPYDEVKISYANCLYKRLKEIDANNMNAVTQIMDEANEKLQIHIVSNEEINNLKRICNPKNYIKPYDSQKIDLANRLYSKLNNKELTDKEYFEIYKEAKLLER